MESDEKSKLLAVGLASIAFLLTIAACVVSFPKVAWGPALVAILVAGFLLEGLSASVFPAGYHSLATGVLFLALFSQGMPQGDQTQALAAFTLLVGFAGIMGVGRLLAPYPDLYQSTGGTRLAGYGFQVIRSTVAAAVAVAAVFFKAGVLVAGLSAYFVCLVFDAVIAGGVVSKTEENETSELFSRIGVGSRAILATPVILGIAASNLASGPIQQSLLLVVALSAVGMVSRAAAEAYLKDLLVKDQAKLEQEILTLKGAKSRLEQKLPIAEAAQKKSKDELRSVYKMAESLGASTNVEDTLKVVAYMTKTLRIPYRSFAIFLSQGGRLSSVYKDTVKELEKVLSMSHLLDLEEVLIKEVWQSGRAQFKPDMGPSTEGRIFKDERSCLCVPLLVSKEPIGVIYVGSLNPNQHSEEDFDNLKMIASLAAPSIKTATLFEENEQRLRTEKTARQGVEAKNAQLAELQLMGQKMGATLNTDTTVKVVAEALLKMTPAQSVILFTPDRSPDAEPNAWKAEFAHTPYDVYVRNLALRSDEGLIGRTLSTKRTLLIRNTANSDLRNLLGAENSIAIAPLYSSSTEKGEGKNEQELLGCLYVGAAAQNALTEDHGNLIETVSYQTAMALKNARLYEQTQQQALTDGLTGLYTHRLFQENIGIELDKAKETGQQMVLCMVDCDNFKTYNDTLGHPAGDALLKDIASLLKDKVRPQDIVARYGGDEFALLFKNTSKAEAVRVCEEIREAFLLRFGGHQVAVTSSIGVACYPIDAITKKDLAKAADDALYVAKRGGRNRVSASKTLSERNQKPLVQEVLPRTVGKA